MRRVAAWAVLTLAIISPVEILAEGILLSDVSVGGAMNKAGFQSGDTLYKINGNPVSSEEEFKTWISLFVNDGDRSLTFSISRNRDCLSLNSVFQNQTIAKKSLDAAPRNSCLRREGGGLVLGKLPPRSDLALAGFRQDDVIHRINGNDISSLSDIRYWVDNRRSLGQNQIDYAVERDRECWVFAVTGQGSSTSAASTKRMPASVCGMAEPPAQTVTPASVRIASVGLILQSGRFGTKGVPVLDVEPGSLARSADIAKGDRITHVNDTLTVDSDTAKLGFEGAASIGSAMVQVDRNGLTLYRTVNFSRPAPPPRVAAVPAPAPVAAPPPAAPATRVTAPSGFSVNVSVVMSALLALALLGFAVARRKGWGRGFTFKPAATPTGFAAHAARADTIEDEEEREIALARQAVETAERGPIQGPAPAETGGPSWFQQQRERREVERARRSMEEAERAAARGQALPQGHYPYPPPPYGYYQQRTPFSEKLRVAYWGLKIALVLVVAVWAWSVTGTVVSMLGAIVPAPLRAVTVDLLAKAQDAISKADDTSN